jgi:hypothetical protein
MFAEAYQQVGPNLVVAAEETSILWIARVDLQGGELVARCSPVNSACTCTAASATWPRPRLSAPSRISSAWPCKSPLKRPPWNRRRGGNGDGTIADSIARGVFSTFAAMIAPCSVNTYGNAGENFSRARWSQFVTTSAFSSAVS